MRTRRARPVPTTPRPPPGARSPWGRPSRTTGVSTPTRWAPRVGSPPIRTGGTDLSPPSGVVSTRPRGIRPRPPGPRPRPPGPGRLPIRAGVRHRPPVRFPVADGVADRAGRHHRSAAGPHLRAIPLRPTSRPPLTKRTGVVVTLAALLAIVAVLAGAGLGHFIWPTSTTSAATSPNVLDPGSSGSSANGGSPFGGSGSSGTGNRPSADRVRPARAVPRPVPVPHRTSRPSPPRWIRSSWTSTPT